MLRLALGAPPNGRTAATLSILCILGIPGTLGTAATVLSGCSDAAATSRPAAPAALIGPRYDAAGALAPPTDYRKWQFLTSGFGMTYGPAAAARVPQHDNVYVRPEVYDRFVETGTWPEQTMFVLEVRTGDSEGSINHGGHFQTDLTGLEAEVKDSRRFPGGWGFFEFALTDHAGGGEPGPSRPAQPLPQGASCYSCHAQNAAVENTFTQFYPTLFPIAQAKGTVRADFIGMPPTVRELARLIAADGWPAGERQLSETARKWPEAAVLQEPALNQLGYKLLAGGKKREGVAVLELVTRRYPDSANAWDSLSEAHESAGNAEGARGAAAQARRRLADDKTLTPTRRAALLKGLDARLARLH